MIPSSATYEVSFDPLASRLTDEDLRNLSRAAFQQQRQRPQIGDFANIMAQRALRTRISEFIRKEGAAVILNNSGTFNVPRSNGANYTAGNPEPIAELNLPIEAFGRMERLISNDIPVEMEIEIQNRFFDSPKIYNVIGEIPGTDKILKNEVVLLGGHIDSWHGGTGAADMNTVIPHILIGAID